MWGCFTECNNGRRREDPGERIVVERSDGSLRFVGQVPADAEPRPEPTYTYADRSQSSTSRARARGNVCEGTVLADCFNAPSADRVPPSSRQVQSSYPIMESAEDTDYQRSHPDSSEPGCSPRAPHASTFKKLWLAEQAQEQVKEHRLYSEDNFSPPRPHTSSLDSEASSPIHGQYDVLNCISPRTSFYRLDVPAPPRLHHDGGDHPNEFRPTHPQNSEFEILAPVVIPRERQHDSLAQERRPTDRKKNQ